MTIIAVQINVLFLKYYIPLHQNITKLTRHTQQQTVQNSASYPFDTGLKQGT